MTVLMMVARLLGKAGPRMITGCGRAAFKASASSRLATGKLHLTRQGPGYADQAVPVRICLKDRATSAGLIRSDNAEIAQRTAIDPAQHR